MKTVLRHSVSCLPSRRAETGEALVAALEKAGVQFIAENGGGAVFV
jgi:hypothetical protein